jgi:hypothetical protein
VAVYPFSRGRLEEEILEAARKRGDKRRAQQALHSKAETRDGVRKIGNVHLEN